MGLYQISLVGPLQSVSNWGCIKFPCDLYLDEGLRGGVVSLLLKHVAQFHVLMFKVIYFLL